MPENSRSPVPGQAVWNPQRKRQGLAFELLSPACLLSRVPGSRLRKRAGLVPHLGRFRSVDSFSFALTTGPLVVRLWRTDFSRLFSASADRCAFLVRLPVSSY